MSQSELEKAANHVAVLLDALQAKDELLWCYRSNRSPSERLFGHLDKASADRAAAKAWLLKARGDAS